jgi:primosomal protein N' (replication factor Y) (superfamily II helicase)
VIVQTSLPHHYAIQCAVQHDYLKFAETELEHRAEPHYPPHVRLVNVLISGTDERAVQDEANKSADWMRELIDGVAKGNVTVTGPAPCPIDKIRGRWRWHFLLRSGSAKSLGLVCKHLQYRYDFKPGAAELRLILDRDPVSLL